MEYDNLQRCKLYPIKCLHSSLFPPLAKASAGFLLTAPAEADFYPNLFSEQLVKRL